MRVRQPDVDLIVKSPEDTVLRMDATYLLRWAETLDVADLLTRAHTEAAAS